MTTESDPIPKPNRLIRKIGQKVSDALNAKVGEVIDDDLINEVIELVVGDPDAFALSSFSKLASTFGISRGTNYRKAAEYRSGLGIPVEIDHGENVEGKDATVFLTNDVTDVIPQLEASRREIQDRLWAAHIENQL